MLIPRTNSMLQISTMYHIFYRFKINKKKRTKNNQKLINAKPIFCQLLLFHHINMYIRDINIQMKCKSEQKIVKISFFYKEKLQEERDIEQ